MDLRTFRSQFPVAERWIYLNHAGVSPISRPAALAMADVIDDACRNGIMNIRAWIDVFARAREKAARLLNAAPADIAWIKNTSEGLSMIAGGLPLRDGDAIVTAAGEFPANYRPWRWQERRGARLVVVGAPDVPPSTDELIAACRESRARVLTLSWVGFHTGWRYDIETLAAFCAEQDVCFAVDAIQGLGALELDLARVPVSALAADAHKWLLGPQGIGILYVRENWRERIAPIEWGWGGVERPLDYFALDQPLVGTAGRYECGTPPTALLYGLDATLELLLSVGMGVIEQRVRELTERLRDGMAALGMTPVVPLPMCHRAGIVNARADDPERTRAMAERLRNGKVAHTWRNGWIRLSPHAYNSDEEIARALALLAGE